MQHTPGPWAWLDEPGKSDLMSLKGPVLRYDSYEGIWFSRYGDGTEDEANARLIAAAPAVVAAAKPLADLVENFTGGIDEMISVSAGELRVLRAAIAAAEGR